MKQASSGGKGINLNQLIAIIFPSIGYHGSSSSIKCHVYHHVGGRRHTPMVCNERREPHTSHYPSNKNTNTKQTTHTSHYRSRLAEILKAAMI